MADSTQLPNDMTRCVGESCGKKIICARHRCTPENGSFVPWAERLCEPGKEHEKFILYREVS